MTIAEFSIAAQIYAPFVIMGLAVFLSLIVLVAFAIKHMKKARLENQSYQSDSEGFAAKAHTFMKNIFHGMSIRFSALSGLFSFEIRSDFSNGNQDIRNTQGLAHNAYVTPSAPLEATVVNIDSYYNAYVTPSAPPEATVVNIDPYYNPDAVPNKNTH